MPIEEGIWRIDNGDVRRVNAAPLEAERRLEDVLVKEISILGLGPLLILDRQVRTEFGGYIDILALDGEGVLHVIELKKGQTPREIVAQALDYGSWVSNLGTERIAETFKNGRFANGRSLQQAFTEQFGSDLPETVNESHQLILVATQLDASTERIVQYLLDNYGVPINAVFFAYFNDAGAEYIARSWLRDPTDAAARSNTNTKRTQERWNEHDFYISFGDGPRRNWEDARKYGFIPAAAIAGTRKAFRRSAPATASSSTCRSGATLAWERCAERQRPSTTSRSSWRTAARFRCWRQDSTRPRLASGRTIRDWPSTSCRSSGRRPSRRVRRIESPDSSRTRTLPLGSGIERRWTSSTRTSVSPHRSRVTHR